MFNEYQRERKNVMKNDYDSFYFVKVIKISSTILSLRLFHFEYIKTTQILYARALLSIYFQTKIFTHLALLETEL